MPATIQHVLTATTPDDPSYEIRPSHWNSAHALSLSLVGSEVIGAFSNDPAYNVTFTTNPSGYIVGSANVTAAPSPVNVTGRNGSSVNAQTIQFDNANGLTLGVSTAANGATVTGSYTVPSQTNQTIGGYAVGNTTGQSSSSTVDARSLSLDGAGIVSLGWSNGTLRISAAQTNQTVASGGIAGSGFTSGGNNIGLSGTLNSNGLSLSATVAAQTNQSLGLYASSQTVGQSSSSTYDARSLTIVGSHIISAGWSNGSFVLDATQSVQTQASGGIAGSGFTSGGNNIGLSGTLNSAGLSLSATVPAQSAQTIGGYFVGNTTGQSSSSTVDARSLSIDAAGIISAGWSAGSIRISATVPAQTNQTLGLYASSNTTAQSSSTTVDARSLSVRGMGVASVGYSAGELVISVPAGGGAGDGGNTLAADTRTAQTNGLVLFSNANGVSFGLNAVGGSVMTASVAAQSVQPVAVSGSNGSFNFSTLSLGSSNGMHFYTTNGSIVGSYTVPAQSAQSLGIYVTQQSTGQSSSSTVDARSLSIIPYGIVSAGLSGGSVVISATQSNQAFSAAGGSSAFQTLGFSDNAHGSWTNTNGSVALAPIKASLYAAGNTTQSSSGTQNLSALSFNGAGIASVGVTNGSVVISVPSGGGAGDGYNIVQAGTTGTTGTTWSSLSATVNINGTEGIIVSQDNSNQIVIGDRHGTLSHWLPLLGDGYRSSMGQRGNGSFYVMPLFVPNWLTFTRVDQMVSINISSSSNSSHAGTLSAEIGIYTRNGNSLSLLVSGQGVHQWTNTSNNSLSVLSGVRLLSAAVATLLSPGQYWVAVGTRTSTANANWWTGSNIVLSNAMTNQPPNPFLAATNATNQLIPGYGMYTASSSVPPDSIAFSQVQGHGSAVSIRHLPPWLAFHAFTA